MWKHLLGTIMALVLVSPAAAQVMIEEGKVREVLAPGSTITRTMTVHNTGDTPVDLRVYWQDFAYTPPFDGRKEFLPAGSTARSLNGWVTFSPQMFHMAPQGTQKISYAVKVPPEAKGGYYGILFFETSGGAPDEKVGLRIVTRIGALFFIETTSRFKKGLVGAVEAQGPSLEGTFSNRGDTILIPQGTFYVLGADGMAAARGEVAPFYLPPGQTARFQAALPKALSAGTYTMVLTFDLDDGDSVVKEADIRKEEDGTVAVLRVRD